MAIFGMDGLKFLALDFLLIFAVYGMKSVALTKTEVEGIQKVVNRKRYSSATKEEKAGIASDARQAILRSMAAKSGRYTADEAGSQAFGGKTGLR